MTDSQYPGALDDDRQLIRVDDNITEIGGDAINSLRSAVFNIEQTLGVNPQGTATDVATRLNQSLNPDGTIKASAISTIGLVTLPITNDMIASNAAIEESKLDLDYPTVNLKNRIDWNFAEIKKLISALTVDIGHLASHVSHPSTWGRHYTSDIDGYTGTAYDGYNLQGIVNDLNVRIINHLADTIDAHDASAISFDDSLTTISADNVQTAIAETDKLIEGATILHQDRQHANGVLKEQNVTYNNSNHSYPLISSSAIQNVSIGAQAIQFVVKPSGFDTITRGDVIDITLNSVVYRRYVNTTDTINAIINFFNPIPTSGSGGVTVVYRSSAETLTPSALNFGIRRENVASMGGSIIQMVHPSAPFLLSSGADPRGLNSSGDTNIKITWPTGNTGDIDVHSLMVAFSALPSSWTIENLSLVLNEEFANQNYPLITFVYRGELGIAFDEPSGYLEITPTSDSAWSVLGFAEGDVGYSLERSFYIDGYRFTELKTIVDAYGDVDAGNTNEITNIDKDIRAAGLKVSGVVRVKNSSGDNGTYIFDQINSGDTLTINEHSFSVTNNVRIISYADSFSVPTIPSQRTLYELFVDGYDNRQAAFRGAKRIEYIKEPSASTQDISSFFDIVDISRDFPEGERRITLTESGGSYSIALGTRGSGASLALSGVSVNLPSASATVVGYNFKLYDYNNIDYIELQVALNYSPLSGTQALDLTIEPRMTEERYLQVGKVLHNKSEFKHMDDRRLFGNVGRRNVRDDYTRDYTSYPRSWLRGNGIIHGFELDASVGGTTITIDGGEVVVNGILYSIDEKYFVVPEDSASTTYNLYVDTDGVLRFEKDDDTNTAHFSPSVSEIINSKDKTILWQIVVNAGNQITEWSDLRRYVINIDNKIELIVEQNDSDGITHGSFESLRSAVNYMNASGTSNPMPRIIRVHGIVTHSIENGVLEIPDGTIIEGDATGRGYPQKGSTILVSGSGTDFIYPGEGVTIRNLNFTSTDTDLRVFFGGTTLKDFVLENCNFYDIATTNSYINIFGPTGVLVDALNNVYVNNCTFVFDDTDADNSVFNVAAGYIWKLTVTNCEVDFSATDATNYFIVSFGMTDSVINNCYLDYPSINVSGAIRGIQCTGFITNCKIQNNIFRNTSADDDTIGITAPLLQGTSIVGNKFEKFYRNIWAGSVMAQTNYVLDNNIVQIGYSAIELENVRNTFINNNYMDAYETETGITFIELTAPWFCTVTANTLASFISTSPADGYMIRFQESSLSNIISENTLVNSDTLDTGFENAIVLDGESGPHLYDSIMDNKITYFGGGSSKGLYIKNSQYTYIGGNAIAASRAPIGTFDAPNLVITGNLLNIVGTETEPAIKMDGSGSLTDSNSIISNNKVIAGVNTDHLIQITSNAGAGGVISDNIITNSGTLSLVHGISVGIGGFNIVNNRIYISTNGSGIYCSGNYCTIGLNTILGLAIGVGITSSGDYCIVALNNLDNIAVGTKRLVTGTGVMDFMNKGATYYAIIPLSRAITETGNSWEHYLASTPYKSEYRNSSGIDEQAAIEFSNLDIPAGSSVTSVEINAQVQDTSDLTVNWRKASWDSSSTSGDLIITGVNPDTAGSYNTFDLTPGTAPEMDNEDVHIIEFVTDSSLSGTVWIRGIRVVYIV